MKKGHRYAPDITGQKFGKLTAIKIDTVKRYRTSVETYWLCECECGNVKSVAASRLKSGYTKSCGCLRGPSRMECENNPDYRKLYQIWAGIKTRCYNQNAKTYKYYGARGIIICDEWANDFDSFYSWSIKNGYTEKLTIDRIDTNGNYEPDNCRWITQKEQSNNTRKNVIIEYKGEIHTFAEWMDILGLNYDVIYNRIHTLGWDVKRAFETPIRKRNFKNRKGEKKQCD